MSDAFITLQNLLPKHLLSRFGGALGSSQNRWVRDAFIGWFHKTYAVDLSDAAIQDPKAYESFNHYFTRALKPGARPIDPDPLSIACPADGAISQCGRIDSGQLLQAKGISYSLAELAGTDELTKFDGGQFATVYLAPNNYHRLHLPLAGELRVTTAIPGELFSVNTATAAGVRNLFCRNERLVCHFDTAAGEVLVVLVGALIVASIETVWPETASPYRHRSRQTFAPGAHAFTKGDEIGRFLLGSTVIVCFEEGAAQWHSSLAPGQVVQMGENIGHINPGR